MTIREKLNDIIYNSSIAFYSLIFYILISLYHLNWNLNALEISFLSFCFVPLHIFPSSSFNRVVLVVLNTMGVVLLDFLGALSLVCLYKTHTVEPGFVSEDWDSSLIGAGFSISQWNLCKKCNNLVIPARAAHCSKLNKCILKYDHYCPWAHQAIGHKNYKYYFLLLTYGLWSVVILAGFCTWDLLATWWEQQETLPVLSLSIFLWSVFIGYYLGPLWILHIRLITKNYTTKEYFQEKEQSISTYNLGALENWKQALGSNIYWWWSPWTNPLVTDGYNYPQKNK